MDGFASIPSEVLGAIVRRVSASILILEFVKISMSAKTLILFVVWIVNAKIVQDLTGCIISDTFIPTYLPILFCEKICNNFIYFQVHLQTRI